MADPPGGQSSQPLWLSRHLAAQFLNAGRPLRHGSPDASSRRSSGRPRPDKPNPWNDVGDEPCRFFVEGCLARVPERSCTVPSPMRSRESGKPGSPRWDFASPIRLACESSAGPSLTVSGVRGGCRFASSMLLHHNGQSTAMLGSLLKLGTWQRSTLGLARDQ